MFSALRERRYNEWVSLHFAILSKSAGSFVPNVSFPTWKKVIVRRQPQSQALNCTADKTKGGHNKPSGRFINIIYLIYITSLNNLIGRSTLECHQRHRSHRSHKLFYLLENKHFPNREFAQKEPKKSNVPLFAPFFRLREIAKFCSVYRKRQSEVMSQR